MKEFLVSMYEVATVRDLSRFLRSTLINAGFDFSRPIQVEVVREYEAVRYSQEDEFHAPDYGHLCREMEEVLEKEQKKVLASLGVPVQPVPYKTRFPIVEKK